MTSGRRPSPCSYAYAVAEARDEIPSFVKMFLRWRATVFSLSTSSPAMERPSCPTPRAGALLTRLRL